jgi:hypothetical protein
MNFWPAMAGRGGGSSWGNGVREQWEDDDNGQYSITPTLHVPRPPG